MKKNILKLLLITLAITTMLFMGGCGSDKPVDENINPTPTQSADLVEPTETSTIDVDTETNKETEVDAENEKENTDNVPNNTDKDENKNKESLTEADKETEVDAENEKENTDNVPNNTDKDEDKNKESLTEADKETEVDAENEKENTDNVPNNTDKDEDKNKESLTEADKETEVDAENEKENTDNVPNNTDKDEDKNKESLTEADKETEVEINDDLVKYENKVDKISFKVPSSWIKIDVEGLTVFFTISINEDFSPYVNLNVQDLYKYDMSLDDYSKLKYTTLEEFEGYKSIDKKAITIDELKGEYTEFTCNSNNGIEVHICQMWTVENDKAYVFTFAATEEEFAKELESFNDLIKTVEIGSYENTEYTSNAANINPEEYERLKSIAEKRCGFFVQINAGQQIFTAPKDNMASYYGDLKEESIGIPISYYIDNELRLWVEIYYGEDDGSAFYAWFYVTA